MTVYLIAFVTCLIIGVPIAFALGLASVVYLLVFDQWHLMIGFPQKMIAGIDNFVLLTIPFFILAGNLMNSADLTRQIVRFAQMLVGRVRGGLAVVNVLSSMMFSGVSGAATAEASAIGSVMIPAMKRDGYRAEYPCCGRVNPGAAGAALARAYSLWCADQHINFGSVSCRYPACVPAVWFADPLCALAGTG
jgi:TRAP-type mannitol/chloroaromatic compound transport system permease large subunit